MPTTPNLDLTRDALATSTLNHGLKIIGDRWTVAILLGAFLGVKRFDEWQASRSCRTSCAANASSRSSPGT